MTGVELTEAEVAAVMFAVGDGTVFDAVAQIVAARLAPVEAERDAERHHQMLTEAALETAQADITEMRLPKRGAVGRYWTEREKRKAAEAEVARLVAESEETATELAEYSEKAEREYDRATKAEADARTAWSLYRSEQADHNRMLTVAAEQEARAEAAEAERDEARGERPSGFWSQRQWEDWSNDLAMLIPEDLIAGNPEGSQESIIEDTVRHLVVEVARLTAERDSALCIAKVCETAEAENRRLAALVEQLTAEREKAEIRAAQEANDAHEWGLENDALKAEVERLTTELAKAEALVEDLRAELTHWKRVAGHVREQAEQQEARAAKAEALVEAGLELADDALAWAEPAVLDINAERRSIAKWVVRYVAEFRAALGGAK